MLVQVLNIHYLMTKQQGPWLASVAFYILQSLGPSTLQEGPAIEQETKSQEPVDEAQSGRLLGMDIVDHDAGPLGLGFLRSDQLVGAWMQRTETQGARQPLLPGEQVAATHIWAALMLRSLCSRALEVC